MASRKYVTITLSTVGLNPTSNNFDIYTDSNNFGYPIAQGITRSALTATTTPFNILVPDDTTKIRVLDATTNCKCLIDVISEDNLCQSCDFDFTTYPLTTVGRLIAGDLTGSCESNITDYRVYWYGPGVNSTNVAYVSGKGSQFVYDFTHPLTGTAALLADAGAYKPVIDKIKINGKTFSQTGDTAYSNNPIPALLECFESVVVNIDAFKCDNGGTSNLPQYEHRVNFTANGTGAAPKDLTGTFSLSANTQYVGFQFGGFSVPDEIKVTFKGSAYSNVPMLLEWWQVGDYVTSQTTTLPYGWNSLQVGPLKKLINLTNLTVNEGDTLKLQVIPNASNPQTSWDYYFTCVDNIACDFCTNPAQYKIKNSSITYASANDCTGSISVSFNVSGCSAASLVNVLPGNFGMGDYFGQNNTYAVNLTPDVNDLVSSSYAFNSGYTGCTYFVPSPYLQCNTPSGSQIVFEKYLNTGVGEIKMTFSSYSDLVFYYNGYITLRNAIWPSPAPPNTSYSSSTGTYYQSIQLTVPSSNLCGDGSTYSSYQIHPSSVVTTGGTGPWTMTMTMPTVVDNVSSGFIPCYVGCSSYLTTYLTTVNGSSTATTNNATYTTTVGAKYLYPYRYGTFYRNVNPPSNQMQREGYIPSLSARNNTIPMSGVSNTQIPSLSALTCNTVINPTYKYAFKVVLEPNYTDFKIYAAPITGGLPLGYPSINCSTLVLTSVGGVRTINDANYVY
jgi:hypothetical protein